MSETSKKIEAQQREMPEPWEGNRPVPWLVISIIAGLFIWSIGYIWVTHQESPASYGDRRSAADFKVAASENDGGAVDASKLYTAHCLACHQATGEGLPGVFPPLADSEWVTGDATVLVQILLHGITGDLTVGGTVYNGQMPAFGDKLDDKELAALASHIRSEFGNSAAEVSVSDVTEQRTAVDRDEPWQGDADLESLK